MKIQLEYKAAGIGGIDDPEIDGGVLSDAWTFRGLASTYDLDLGGDIIERGAYADSLRERPQIPVLWSHQSDEPIGKTVLLQETEQGLFFKAALTDSRRGTDARKLIRDRVLTGCSIGYNARKTGRRSINGQSARVLKVIDLHEISLVTFPMQQGARVDYTGLKRLLDFAEIEALKRRGLAIPARLRQSESIKAGYDIQRAQNEINAQLQPLQRAERERLAQLIEVTAALAELAGI